MVLAHLALLMALQAPKAPPHKAPTPLHNPLIMPGPGANLSAFRFDTEVFGWNKAFTEVGAVAMEMARDELGGHTGETFLLVYPTRSTKPKHNVICHFITHVALPDNPVPLEQASDYLWTIEWSYQNMWPRRPKYKRPKDGMAVTTLWAPMPSSAATQETGKHPSAPRDANSASHTDSGQSCVPWVGFRLQMGREVRLHPYRPIDLSARCDLLQLTESRTYWGTPTIAASMVRFDFNASPVNEESARFVVSALWNEARHLTFVLETKAPLTPKHHQAWRRLLRPWGRMTIRAGTASSAAQQAPGPLALTIHAAPGWLPLAHALAKDLGYGAATSVPQADLGDRVVLTLAPKSVDSAAPLPQQPSIESSRRKLQPAPDPGPSNYLNDFKVP